MFTAPRRNQFSLNWNENNKGRERIMRGINGGSSKGRGVMGLQPLQKRIKRDSAFFTYAFLSFLCLKQVCKVNKHAILKRFLLIPLFYKICGSAPWYTIRALKNILASHMTWMFPCKIWFRQWNINRWITCRCFLWKPVNQVNFVNLNTYLSIVERKSSWQTWKMYACESSIKYVITHWRVFLLWKQFSQVWYTCRFRESSKRKKYLLCPPILVARDHYTWNGLSDEVV